MREARSIGESLLEETRAAAPEDGSDRATTGSRPPEGPRKRVFKKKVLFLSKGAVGKSALIHRLLYDAFERGLPPTTGIDFLSKTVHISGHVAVRLQIWDTSGQERFRSLIPPCLLDDTSGADASAAVVVYDVSQRTSFEAAPELLRLARGALGAGSSLLLVGGRADAEGRQVSFSEGSTMAGEYGAFFFETSAATGSGAPELLHRISTETAWLELGPEDPGSHTEGEASAREGLPEPLLATDDAPPKSSSASLCRIAAELISGRCLPGKELWC